MRYRFKILDGDTGETSETENMSFKKAFKHLLPAHGFDDFRLVSSVVRDCIFVSHAFSILYRLMWDTCQD